MSKHTYKTSGTCMQLIIADIDDETNIITDINFMGGCQGNLSALRKFIIGNKIDKIIEMFKGDTCGRKTTSCMDQLANMLESIKCTHIHT